MKILHISSEPPGDKSGGQLVVKESINALSKYAKIDYMGPINNCCNNMLESKYYIKTCTKKIEKIRGLMTLNLSSYYKSFNDIAKKIDIDKYEYVYIEFSKWFFATKYAKKNGKKVITRLHNIEKDYSYNLYKLNRSIRTYLAYLYYSYIEKKILKLSDFIIVLTENDKGRIQELYGEIIDKSKIIIMPVCVSERNRNNHKMDKNNINILVTGSLWYGPNYDGIKWFINEVWGEIKEYCTLYVVGSNPNEELKSMIETSEKIQLIENPENTKMYFELADIYIAPIFTGAGMKVKNAEAMSYGLPIVGTEHSFIGYESSKNLHHISNDKNEFISAINMYKTSYLDKYDKHKESIIQDFNKKYSISNSYKYLDKILDNNEVYLHE